MPLVLPESSSHWYFRDGSPCYELPMKTRPGEMRSPTVRDARELGLVPSVTGIGSMLHKPGLQAWIVTQYVLSALTLPRFDGESQDDFASRVVKDARVESNRAADFGTRVHELAELYLLNELPETVDTVELSFLTGFMQWCKDHKVEPIGTEVCFASDDYGGRVDFIGYVDEEFLVVDWKTQKTVPGRGVNFYNEWAPQLAAYRYGVEEEKAGIMSVVISSTEPGRVESKLWEGDWAWECFEALKSLYYSPLGPGGSLRSKE